MVSATWIHCVQCGGELHDIGKGYACRDCGLRFESDGRLILLNADPHSSFPIRLSLPVPRPPATPNHQRGSN